MYATLVVTLHFLYNKMFILISRPRIAKTADICYNSIIKGNGMEKNMDTAAKIKELRESVGMNRKEFSEHTGIPVRTLEDWEAARRTPPEYIPRLIAYQLKYEQMMREKEN